MKRLKNFLIVIAILALGILCMPNSAYATLQSNPATQYTTKKNGSGWLSEIRKMETTGGAMGLTEQLNSDLTSATGSNNIDVHMMKNTEYGAIAILSASNYGNPTTIKLSTLQTTTGNKTGLYYSQASRNDYQELVAGTRINDYTNINARYLNRYTGSETKKGDALNMRNWHGAGYSSLLSDSNSDSVVRMYLRNYNGYFAVFNEWSDHHTTSEYSRGVAVCGEGL